MGVGVSLNNDALNNGETQYFDHKVNGVHTHLTIKIFNQPKKARYRKYI